MESLVGWPSEILHPDSIMRVQFSMLSKPLKFFFLLFSPYSDASEQCLKEVDRAVNARLPIIPFRVVEHTPTEAMEYYLCNTHWLDAFSRPTGEYFPKLLSTCRRILDGKTPEVVTPSRPQKPIEEMSEGMRAMLKRVESEAKKDEEEGRRYKKTNDENDPDKTAPMQNPFTKEAQALKGIEGGKVDRNYAPKVEAKKKSPNLKVVQSGRAAPKVEALAKKRKIEFKSPDEIGREKQKKKSKIPVIFVFTLFGFGMFMYLEDTTKRKKEFKNVSENIRKIQKQQGEGSSIDEVESKIDYQHLSSKILDKERLTFASDEELEHFKSLIVAKDGNLFVKQGANLVEKDNNRFEINNLAIIDSRFHEKRIQRLKSLQSQNLDLNKKNPILYFEPTKFKDDLQTSASWKLHYSLMLKLVRTHRILAKTTKNYPDQDEWNSEYLREKGNMVLETFLSRSKDTHLKIKVIDNGRSNYNFEAFKSELENKAKGKVDLYQIDIEQQETREVPRLEIDISVGNNLKEAIESELLGELEVLVGNSLSSMVKQ